MQVELIDLVTPKKYQLHGIWAGNEKAKNVYIFVHGLSGNLFSGRTIFGLVGGDNSVLSFSNRGNGIVSKLKHLNPDNPRGYDREVAGVAHEKFVDCVDDIAGAVEVAATRGAKNIYLVGQSTGCQKSVFYASKTQDERISGIVLLCPLSDYASILKMGSKEQYEKALSFARESVKKGTPHRFIPEELWPEELLDAQRFISLYTPDSPEEVFTYWDDQRKPDTYRSIQHPLFVLIAGDDEYADRPNHEILAWFDKNHRSVNYKSHILPGADHGLKGYEEQVCDEIKNWANEK